MIQLEHNKTFKIFQSGIFSLDYPFNQKYDKEYYEKYLKFNSNSSKKKKIIFKTYLEYFKNRFRKKKKTRIKNND